MKKSRNLLLLLSILVLSFLFAACSSSQDANKDTEKKDNSKKEEEVKKIDINIAAMKGPTAIGMVNLFDSTDSKTSSNNYKYQIFGTPDEVSTGLMSGSLDIAAVPANLASVLYNKSEGKIVVAAINTTSVLYIVETGDSIKSVADLKGKTIYSSGQGTTPEYTLRHLLLENDIDPDKDVEIVFKSEATEVASILKTTKNAVAMLPEPFVTIAKTSNENLKVALNVGEEWEKLNKDSSVVTGVIVMRKDFIEKNDSAVKAFLKEYEASTTMANKEIDKTAALLEKYDIFKAAIAKTAIPNCNVVYIDGDLMKSKLSSYLKVLFDQNPKAVGGKIPEDNFYYN